MRMLRYLMDYLDKEYDITQIEDVKPFHIKHFLLLKQEEGKKPQYINDLLKVYKTFFRYLEEEDYLDKAPTAKIHNVKQPKVLIRTFSEDEIRRMLNYCNGRDFVSIRNKALLSILFDTSPAVRIANSTCESLSGRGKSPRARITPISIWSIGSITPSPSMANRLNSMMMVRSLSSLLMNWLPRLLPDTYTLTMGRKTHKNQKGKIPHE